MRTNSKAKGTQLNLMERSWGKTDYCVVVITLSPLHSTNLKMIITL